MLKDKIRLIVLLFLLVAAPAAYAYDGAYTGTQVDSGIGYALDALIIDIADLSDPGADRVLGWDETVNDIIWFSWGLNIATSGSVINVAIDDDYIDSQHYAAASIDNEHLADDAVDSDELASGSVDLAHMSVNSIDSDQYVDGSIDAAHLAADIVDETKIADDGIDSEHYNDGSIDAAHLAADIIDETKIADNGIDSEHYNDGSIDTAHLAADAVDSTLIADNAIDTEHLADDAVDSDEIAALAIDFAHMSVNSIDSDQYIDGSIDLIHMSSDSIDSSQYIDGSIDLAHMSANSIDSDQYVDASIDLAHMSVNSIDSDQYVDASIDLAHMSVDSIDSDQYVDGSIDEAHIDASNAPTDEYFLSYEADTTNFQWVAAPGGGDITEVGLCATGACTDDFIDGTDIGDDVIESEHYAATSIDNEHLADNAADSDEIAAGAIDLAHMSVNSIDSDQYVDASIDAAHLAADVIDESKIADNGIDSEHYNDGSIDAAHLAADIVDETKIADDGIDSEHYNDNSIDAAHLNFNYATSSGEAGAASTVTIADNESTNENNAVVFLPGGDLDGGDLALESDGTFYYNPSTGMVTSTGFTGTLTGNVTGAVTGNVTGDLTGKADTADALETARTIAGVSFDGTGNIAIASTGLSDTADLLYEAELDAFSEAQAQIADKTLINEEDAITLDAALTVDAPVFIKEQAAASADVAAYGQLWISNTVPNTAYFTDDAGTDFQLGVAAGGGDQWGDAVDADILPTGADDTYDLGAAAAQFKDGFFDGTLEADTLTEEGSAVYNATETPGGELGGTFASFTIDDSLSVANWTFTGSVTATGLIGDEDLQSEDFGDWTCAGEDACTLDADTVAAAEMADADHGDFTWSSGTATLDADVVAAAEMADADHGDVSWSSGVATVQAISGANAVDSDAYIDDSIDSVHISTIVESAFWDAAGMISDGTQCVVATSPVTINSGPMQYTAICADNDASTLYGHIVMPDSWDGGTVTFEIEYLQTAADTSALNGDVAAMCRGATETVNNTWGSEIAIDDAAVTGSNSVDHTTSAAVTANGTCAGGDTMYFRWQLDATGTTTAVATLHILGMKMEYTSNVGD